MKKTLEEVLIEQAEQMEKSAEAEVIESIFAKYGVIEVWGR